MNVAAATVAAFVAGGGYYAVFGAQLGVVVVGPPVEDALSDGKPPSHREPAEPRTGGPAHGAWAESWLLQ